PAAIERLGVEVFHDMAEGLKGVDIVMMLRLQLERMHGSFVPSTREYFHFFGLDYDKLKMAKPDALIMHPGPMNRGVEIGSEIADDIDRSLIRQQVEMGVAVRMACLEILGRDRGQGNARLIDPASGRDAPGDLLVADDGIAAIGPGLAADGAEIVDCAGLCLAPGLVDMRVQLREPGAEHMESIESGGLAA